MREPCPLCKELFQTMEEEKTQEKKQRKEQTNQQRKEDEVEIEIYKINRQEIMFGHFLIMCTEANSKKVTIHLSIN